MNHMQIMKQEKGDDLSFTVNIYQLTNFLCVLCAISAPLCVTKIPNPKSQINMKPIHIFYIFLFAISTACGTGRPAASRFVEHSPQLGINKESFIGTYGNPYRQNVFYDEEGAFCEELIYRELIQLGETTFSLGEPRAINSVFLFRDGKLVSQIQEDDMEYQHQLERARERRLIKEGIDAEKERAAAERERAAAEKERIEMEKKKAEEKE